MDIFDLYAKISLDSSGYTKGLSSASSSFDSFKTGVSSGLSSVAKIAAAAIAAVTTASVAMGKKLVSDANQLAGQGDHIDKMSQKMGMSAQAYQEWDAVLQHSGSSIDSMRASMKTLANAAQTNNKAFEQLGITQKDLKNLSQEELFAKTIEQLQKVDDTTTRTYLAGKLLGRGATELGALLNTSAEDTQKMKDRVHQLGGVMSDDAVKASAKFKDNLQDLKTALSGVKRGMVSETLPAFNDLMGGFTMLLAGEEGAEKAIDSGTKKLEKAILNISPKISKLTTTLLPKAVKIATDLITEISKTLPQLITDIAPVLFNAGVEIISNIGKGVFDQLDKSNFDEGAKTLTAKFNGLINNIDADGAGEKLSGVVNKFITAGFNIVSTMDFKGYATQLSSFINSTISNIDWATLGQTISAAWKGVWDFIGTALENIDWAEIGNKIGEFISSIDWWGILNSMFKAIGNIIKAAPEFLMGVIEKLDFTQAAGLIALLFAPKIAKKLAGKLLEVFKSDGDTKGTLKQGGEAAGDTVSEGISSKGTGGGIGFASALKAGVEGFMVGWEIGTFLYNTFQEQFDWWGEKLGAVFAKGITEETQRAVKNAQASMQTTRGKAKEWEKKGYKIDWTNDETINKSIEHAIYKENQKNKNTSYATWTVDLAGSQTQKKSSGFDASQYMYKSTGINSNIYLDSGKLVGGTSAAYSNANAQNYTYTQKGYA